MRACAIRTLTLDAVAAANSGHSGMPMGMADVATVLFDKHLRFQFDAINLTDAYVRTHLRNENQLGSVTQLGRRFIIGARYKF